MNISLTPFLNCALLICVSFRTGTKFYVVSAFFLVFRWQLLAPCAHCHLANYMLASRRCTEINKLRKFEGIALFQLYIKSLLIYVHLLGRRPDDRRAF